ncbi:hypothetical protein ACNVED_04455 [Legionella sp. D16C41]|uniref:hypothetical protein n=1 Tax=Legionella sp. D16C41 TaxID=3402688 RepID=UPI003AF7C491
MNFSEFLEWVKQFAEQNKDNVQLSSYIKEFNDCLNERSLVNCFYNISTLLVAIEQLQNINYNNIYTAKQVLENLNLYIFNSSMNDFKGVILALPRAVIPIVSSVDEQTGEQTIVAKINKLYNNYKQSITAEGIRKHLPRDELEWHAYFVQVLAKQYGGTDFNYINFNAFLNATSALYGKNIRDLSVPNQLKSFHQVNQDDLKNFAEYSKSLANGSSLYKSRFEEFKRDISSKKEKEIKQQSTIDLLKNIKTLIEQTPWKVGKWGSKSEIEVDGKLIKVPNHIYKIYEKAKAGIDTPQLASEALTEISKIAEKAVNDKPLLFSSYRKRDKQTQEAYDSIVNQTKLQ